MKCTVCGCKIGYEENFRQHESNKDEICMSPDCLHKHMIESITMADLAKYAEGEAQLMQQITMHGVEALPADEMEWLTEWYEQFYHTCENDEPDEATLKEWNDDRQYQNTEYYQMVMPK